MNKFKINQSKLSTLNGDIIVKKGIALLLAGISTLSFSGCGREEMKVSNADTKTFIYSYADQEALGIIPNQIKGFRQLMRDDDHNIGKERELEKKYVFDIGKYYDYVIDPDAQQVLYLLGHNEACDESVEEIWSAIKDSEKVMMSTAYLKREFATVFPDPERYASYYYYIGNSSIFDADVDYQILKSDDYNYYLLKTYSLTLNKQPQGVETTWPVGETFKYVVFAKMNLDYGTGGYVFNGLDIIAEQFEGIGSDAADSKEGTVNIDDILHPIEPSKILTLSRGE